MHPAIMPMIRWICKQFVTFDESQIQTNIPWKTFVHTIMHIHTKSFLLIEVIIHFNLKNTV